MDRPLVWERVDSRRVPGSRASLPRSTADPADRLPPHKPARAGPTTSQLRAVSRRRGGHRGIGSVHPRGHQSTTDEWENMRSKKQKSAVEKSSAKQKELEKSISVLRGQLSRTEKALTKAKNQADRWRKEAKAQKSSASRARARVEKLRQKLDGASAAPNRCRRLRRRKRRLRIDQ